MKKFAKKSLAIAVIMMAFGGMTNMAHASDHLVASKNISADRHVKAGSILEVVFEATPNEITAGELVADAPVFHVVARDTTPHDTWNIVPTGKSVGGYMVTADGKKARLQATKAQWKMSMGGESKWELKSREDLDDTFYLAKGLTVEPGLYQFTGKVDEYAN